MFRWNGKELKTFADVQEATKRVNDIADVAALANIICSMYRHGLITLIEVYTAGGEMEPQLRRITERQEGK